MAIETRFARDRIFAPAIQAGTLFTTVAVGGLLASPANAASIPLIEFISEITSPALIAWFSDNASASVTEPASSIMAAAMTAAGAAWNALISPFTL